MNSLLGTHRRLERLLQLLLFVTTSLNVVRAQQSQVGWPNGTARFEIQWNTSASTSQLEIGTLQVPIDWSNPSGPQTFLGLQRVRASSNITRQGSLIFNPGGPGQAATTLCSAAAFAFSASLLGHYDLICPDPRGVGTSQPIACDPEIWNEDVGLSPRNESEFEALVDWSRRRGESCLNATGDLLAHVDTISAANDLEAIRLALGGEPLNWLGQSYGSMLGAQYAELFPENVGAMVFDGVENHALDPATTLFVKSTTYDNSLNRFFDWCTANATRCGFRSNNIAETWHDLIANATRSPLAARGCTGNSSSCHSTVSGSDILVAAQSMLLFQNNTLGGFVAGWNALGSALNTTINGNDATPFSPPKYQSRTDGGFAGIAVECLDWTRFPNATANKTIAYATFRELHMMGQAFNPSVGIYSNAYLREVNCIGWPIPPVPPGNHALNQTAVAQLPPILMVASTHDAFTSYAWAMGVKSQIPGAVLVTREGDGHTNYFLRGAASRLIDAFLVNGTVPADGTVVVS